MQCIDGTRMNTRIQYRSQPMMRVLSDWTLSIISLQSYTQMFLELGACVIIIIITITIIITRIIISKNIFLENSNILYFFPKQGCFTFKNFAIQHLLAFMPTWLSSLIRDVIWIMQRDI